jgi:hypothetical protein
MKANNPENPQGPVPGPQAKLKIEAGEPEAHYINLTRVTAGPEELIVDLGMTVPTPQNPQELVGRFTERVVLNYYNAKRLTLALQATIGRYEQRFGSIEIDPNKRAGPGAAQEGGG